MADPLRVLGGQAAHGKGNFPIRLSLFPSKGAPPKRSSHFLYGIERFPSRTVLQPRG